MISRYFQRFYRILFVLIAVIAICISIYYFSSYTYPFIIALIIAFFMNPAVNFLHVKGKLPRSLAVFIVLIIIFGFITGLLVLLFTELISGAEYLAKTIPKHMENILIFTEKLITDTIIPFFNQMNYLFESLNEDHQTAIITNIQNLVTEFTTTIGSILQRGLSKIPGLISWFPNAAMVFLFIVLGTYFISKDWYRLKGLAGRYVPRRIKMSSMKVYQEIRKALFGFIYAQLVLISITFLIVLTGLFILKVKYPLAMAFIIGLIDILPYLGTGIIFIPWIIYEFIVQNHALALGLIVLYVIVIVQRQLMEPKIVSAHIGLHPLLTLISIFIGIRLFGFLGLIIGPFVAIILITIYRTGIFHDLWMYIKG